MKKFNKMFLSLALVLILAIPMLAGCEFSFNGNGNNTNKTVAEITTTSDIRTTYTAKEQIDFQNAKLKVTYDDDTTKEISLDKSMVSGFDTTTFGSKEMVISYGGVNKTINYQVELKLGMYKMNIITYYMDNQSVDISNELKDYLDFKANYVATPMHEENGEIVAYSNGGDFAWRYQGNSAQVTYYSIWSDMIFSTTTEFQLVVELPETMNNYHGYSFNKIIAQCVYEA